MIQFIHASNLESFQSNLSSGAVDSSCIAYIVEEKMLYANGTYFLCAEEGDITSLEEALEALTTRVDTLETLTDVLSDGTVVVSTNSSGNLELSINNGSTLTLAEDGTLDVNVDGTTIIANEDGTISAVLTTYVGSEAITVNDGTISLVIDDNDGILSQSDSGLLATLSITYDSSSKSIYLYGNDTENPLSTIDATDFIKDGMLSSATLYTATAEDTSLTEGNKYIVLTFNTDAEADPIYLDVNDLVDVYTAGNGIAVSDDNVISVVIDSDSEEYLSVSESGVKLSGVADAINSAISALTASDIIYLTDETVADALNSLSEAINEVSSSITDLDADEVGGEGQYIQSISETDGIITAVAADLTASNVTSTAVESTDDNVAVESTNVLSAIEELAAAITTAKEEAVAEALASLEWITISSDTTE